MTQYQEIYDDYEWSDAWDAFEGERDGWFNLGYETIGKHADGDNRDAFAVRIVDFEDGGAQEFTYGDLDEMAGRFINYMHDLGLEEGDLVAAMLEPTPELYTTMLGCWLGRFQFVPLFSLFGPDAVNYRLDDAGVSAMVTSPQHRDKVDVDEAADLEHVILVGADRDPVEETERSFDAVADYATTYDVADTHSEDTAAIQYTSGTTGAPKGVKMKHSLPIALYPSFKWAADQRPADNYFGAAPPAWSYGLYGCTAFPLHIGMGTTSYRGEFDPNRFVETLQTYEITNLFAPPTLLRQLSQLPIELGDRDFDLRIVVSAGEPLDPGTVNWVRETFDATMVDHYGFTEGSMVVNNYAFDDWELKPGSMGKPTPGYDVRLLELDDDEEVEQGDVGEIAIRTEGVYFGAEEYLNRPQKSEEKWGGDWLRSDDLGRVDEDGYFWFEGRADDVILSAGYRIGPTEVENTMMKHDSVAEVAVVGLPDHERGEIVAAFVVLADDAEKTDDLKADLQDFVATNLSKHEYPREIHFVNQLPKTASGKIQRFKLREEYAD